PRRVYTYPEGLGWEIYNLISTIGVYVIVLGIGAFVVNLVYSWFRGEPAGAKPWGGDTLEWSVPSPPLQHNFSVSPVITSRHPLWDQDDLHSGADEGVAKNLAAWPLRWRAVLITTTTDARPEEVVRVAGPSIWPFVAACGTLAIFAAELMK